MFLNWAAKIAAISWVLCSGQRTAKHLATHNCIWMVEENRHFGWILCKTICFELRIKAEKGRCCRKTLTNQSSLRQPHTTVWRSWPCFRQVITCSSVKRKLASGLADIRRRPGNLVPIQWGKPVGSASCVATFPFYWASQSLSSHGVNQTTWRAHDVVTAINM